jgi:hypothetical protein
VAPEFWYYYPAAVLGVDMIEFEREIPHWKALQATFSRFGCEGWGIASANVSHPDRKIHSKFEKISDCRYRETTCVEFGSKQFESSRIYSRDEPSWAEQHPVKDESELGDYIDSMLSEKTTFDFASAIEAHNGVGEDYLIELYIGVPFFDFINMAMGFEKAVYFFMSGNEELLESWLARYIEYERRLVAEISERTPFEALFIGCSHSTNSLIGPTLWRKWDKPFIRAMCDAAHSHGLLLHAHIHGRCMDTVADFAEIGIDCVCPFERPPGGDVAGRQGLELARRAMADRVTFNGNVHTVHTLIRGTPEMVAVEVSEIKEVFAGSKRLIIGSGDQVGRETPEENIKAMVAAATKP